MHLRARKAGLSVPLGCCSVTNELVCAMTYRMYGALIASLSVVALMLAAHDTCARAGGASRGWFTSTHSISRPSVDHSFRHHRRNNVGIFWPTEGDFSYGPSNGEPLADVTQPSGDVHYTYTYDVPWDWAHRFPPAVAPSQRPYVPNCPAAPVPVPGRHAREQTVNVIRCY